MEEEQENEIEGISNPTPAMKVKIRSTYWIWLNLLFSVNAYGKYIQF